MRTDFSRTLEMIIRIASASQNPRDFTITIYTRNEKPDEPRIGLSTPRKDSVEIFPSFYTISADRWTNGRIIIYRTTETHHEWLVPGYFNFDSNERAKATFRDTFKFWKVPIWIDGELISQRDVRGQLHELVDVTHRLQAGLLIHYGEGTSNQLYEQPNAVYTDGTLRIDNYLNQQLLFCVSFTEGNPTPDRKKVKLKNLTFSPIVMLSSKPPKNQREQGKRSPLTSTQREKLTTRLTPVIIDYLNDVKQQNPEFEFHGFHLYNNWYAPMNPANPKLIQFGKQFVRDSHSEEIVLYQEPPHGTPVKVSKPCLPSTQHPVANLIDQAIDTQTPYSIVLPYSAGGSKRYTMPSSVLKKIVLHTKGEESTVVYDQAQQRTFLECLPDDGLPPCDGIEIITTIDKEDYSLHLPYLIWYVENGALFSDKVNILVTNELKGQPETYQRLLDDAVAKQIIEQVGYRMYNVFIAEAVYGAPAGFLKEFENRIAIEDPFAFACPKNTFIEVDMNDLLTMEIKEKPFERFESSPVQRKIRYNSR